MTRFPNISDERRKEMLSPQPGRVRVVIDTDAANEVDDQFAITWGLLSPDRLDIEAIVAAPFSRAYFREPLLAAARANVDHSTAAEVDDIAAWVHRLRAAGIDPEDVEFETVAEGMEMSFDEIGTLMGWLGMSSEGVAFRGAARFMESPDDIVDSEGARRIIEAAMADDDRLLHVVAIGAVTNIAAALLMEPEIITRMVVSWTSAYPTFVRFSNSPSMNLVQDQHASRLLFNSGVPLLYLPGYYIGEQLVMSLPESERWVNGRGEIGNYLHYLYRNNRLRAQRLVEPFPGQSWVCWDFINFAWLIDPTWVPTMFVPTPALDDNLVWRHLPDRPLMSEATDIDRDAVYRDFFRKLDRHSKTVDDLPTGVGLAPPDTVCC